MFQFTFVKTVIGWESLYLEGSLEIEDVDGLTIDQVLEEIKDYQPFEVNILWANADWLLESGGYPDRLEDVVTDEDDF